MTLRHGSRPVDTIFIHQLTTRPEWFAGKSVDDIVAEVARWHKGRGWRTIGYHYVIDRKGKVGVGRKEHEIGAHVAGHNTGSIGIALAGGHGASKEDAFSDHFTEQQDAALRDLIADIQTRANIKRIRGHSEVANKACPGFTVAKWLAAGDPEPVATAKSEVKAAMKQSKKYQATGCAKWGMVAAGGVSTGWPSVKSQIGIGQDMLATFEKLVTSNSLLLVAGLCIVSAIVFNWLQLKQKDDFAEGRYTPSGASE